VVSADTYQSMRFWLPILAAAISAYLGDRIARWLQQRYEAREVSVRST
jgi:predicted PurR-regulated permease PerM